MYVETSALISVVLGEIYEVLDNNLSSEKCLYLYDGSIPPFFKYKSPSFSTMFMFLIVLTIFVFCMKNLLKLS